MSESSSDNGRYIFRSLCKHQESRENSGDESSAAPPAVVVADADRLQRSREAARLDNDSPGTVSSVAALRSVVRIYVDELRFDWLRPYNKSRSGSGVGSGAVIDADEQYLYLLTAFHVVSSAVRVRCSFSALGRAIYDATLLGACPEVDAALLRVAKSDLPANSVSQTDSGISVLPFGDSDRMQTDDEVRALGFPQGENSVWSTKGVISGRLADTGQFQLGASINPGNSGGPVIDRRAELIGVVVSKHSQGSGMGYVTPLAQIRHRLAEMQRFVPSVAVGGHRKNGIVKIPSYNCVLGIGNRALLDSLGAPNDASGAFVRYVVPDSVLHRAGMRSGDILVRLGCALDFFGQVEVEYWNKRLHIDALMPRASLHTELLVEWWCAKERRLRNENVLFDESARFGLRERHPPREPVDYETFGGVVVMQLNVQHLRTSQRFSERYRYVVEDPALVDNPPLVVTHIMSGSSLSGQPLIESPDRIMKLNGIDVRTLSEYRRALLDGSKKSKYVRWTTKDGQMSVLEYAIALKETQQFATEFGFELSKVTLDISAVTK